MAVAAAIASLSASLLAADATLDLSAGGFAKRLERAQATIVAAMGQHQLAFAVRAGTRGKTLPEQPCPRNACYPSAADAHAVRKQNIACRSAIAQSFGPFQKKIDEARGFEPPTPSLPD